MGSNLYDTGFRGDWDESVVTLLERRGLVQVETKSVDAPPMNKMAKRAARKEAVSVE